MKWGEQDWQGVVLAVEDKSSEESSDSDADFDIPLAQLKTKSNKNKSKNHFSPNITI